jgi:hypothetical protein
MKKSHGRRTKKREIHRTTKKEEQKERKIPSHMYGRKGKILTITSEEDVSHNKAGLNSL